MSMMWPPQSVKIVSTPSLFSALATRWPPEITPASRLLRCRVSSAVVLLDGIGVGLTLAMVPPWKSRGTRAARVGGRAHRERLAALREMPYAHRLEYHQSEESRNGVAGHGDGEDRAPAMRLRNDRCD